MRRSTLWTRVSDTMRTDVAFDADGTTLRGWLYLPNESPPPHPIVVMAHGFSALKEMGLDDYAEVFSAAGLACLVYDNRTIGASEGEPRCEIDPVAQMRDYRHAITYAESLRDVDASRIGIWGTSYTGGLVLIVAAVDRRVKCVVSQVPMISGYDTMMETSTAAGRQAFFQMIESERRALARGKPPSSVPVCVDDPAKPEDSPARLSHRYFHHYVRERHLDWPNRVTARSLDLRLEYEAMPYVRRIGPTPLLMIVAANDTITPTAIALRAFEQALEPKRLVSIPGHHYVPYREEFERSSAEARDWFARHLGLVGNERLLVP
jgi:fermentation-respiration switch protein FrsA (DUF1100 family)